MRLVDRWKRRSWRANPAAMNALPGTRPAIVITGGSDGIGRALAKAFAASNDSRDHTILLIARDPGRLVAAKTELERIRPAPNANLNAYPIITLSQDITAADAPSRIAECLATNDLFADILINSAGIGTTGDFAEAAPERLTAEVELNVTALTRLCRAFLPAMLIRGRGGIINISSLGGFAPGPYQAAYYASKAYVTSLTRALALETRGQGVRIAVVAPGPVNTQFHARADAETALYRRILPALSADAIAASTRRGYKFGHTLIIPGLFSNLTALAMRVLPARLVAPVIAILLKPRPPGHPRQSPRSPHN